MKITQKFGTICLIKINVTRTTFAANLESKLLVNRKKHTMLTDRLERLPAEVLGTATHLRDSSWLRNRLIRKLKVKTNL
jgi:hypothetical protein